MEPAFSVLDNSAFIRFEEEGEGEQVTAIYKTGESGDPSLTQMITNAQNHEMEELFASDDVHTLAFLLYLLYTVLDTELLQVHSY
jgi:hypothetical protein